MEFTIGGGAETVVVVAVVSVGRVVDAIDLLNPPNPVAAVVVDAAVDGVEVVFRPKPSPLDGTLLKPNPVCVVGADVVGKDKPVAVEVVAPKDNPVDAGVVLPKLKLVAADVEAPKPVPDEVGAPRPVPVEVVAPKPVPDDVIAPKLVVVELVTPKPDAGVVVTPKDKPVEADVVVAKLVAGCPVPKPKPL